MNKWIIDEPTLLHIMSVAIGAAYVSVEDASKRLGVTAPIMQAATRDTLRPDVPKPDTHYIAPFTGHTLKYHSLDQIVEYANACVRAASAPSADAVDADDRNAN